MTKILNKNRATAVMGMTLASLGDYHINNTQVAGLSNHENAMPQIQANPEGKNS